MCENKYPNSNEQEKGKEFLLDIITEKKLDQTFWMWKEKKKKFHQKFIVKIFIEGEKSKKYSEIQRNEIIPRFESVERKKKNFVTKIFFSRNKFRNV